MYTALFYYLFTSEGNKNELNNKIKNRLIDNSFFSILYSIYREII